MSSYVGRTTQLRKRIAGMAAVLAIAFALLAVADARADLTHPYLPGASLDGSNSPAGEFNTPCGDAVDSHGDVYVANFGGSVIDVFGPDGSFITSIEDTNGPCGLAVDSVGTIYVYEFDQGQRTVKFTPNSFPPTATTTYGSAVPLAGSDSTYGIGVNRANDRVYLSRPNQGAVSEYKSAAEGSALITEDFGAAALSAITLGGFQGIGVDGTSGDVYVAGVKEGAVPEIAVLDPTGSTVLHHFDGSDSPEGGFEVVLAGLGVDESNGNVFITDIPGHGVVQEYTSSGVFVGQIGPTFGGSETFSNPEPSDVAIAPPGTPNAGNVYVTSGAGAEGNVFAFGPLQEPKVALTVSKSGSGGGTVTSDIGGINCGSTCTAEFEEGEVVSLTATPDGNSEFKGWGGACMGAGACSVTISEAKAVTAEFTAKAATTVALSVSKSGTGAGTVRGAPAGIDCGSVCAASFAKGSVVTLVASASSGSEFKGWSGSCSGTGSCVVTLDAARSVGAQFDIAPGPPSSGGGGSGGSGGGTKPTCATDASLCPPGTGTVAGTASVKGGKAEVKVSCPGPGSCSGSLKLTAKITTGKGKNQKTKKMVVGKASFSLQPGVPKVLKVPLNGAAKQVLAKGKSLRATVSGTGLKSGSITLKPAGKPKKK